MMRHEPAGSPISLPEAGEVTLAPDRHDATSRAGPRRAAGEAIPAVRLEGMTRLFGGHPGLVRVDLTAAAGKALLVSGPNGSGKTTLLRLLATAISPTYGGGRVLGFDLVRQREEVRARTELLGHRTRLYEDLTPAEYLRFVAALWGCADERIGAALGRAGLSAAASERIRGFSQGMRQRLALARALLRRPDLLLLDEPYAALDEEAKDLVDETVREARTEGRTVIVATHDSGRAAALVDRAVRLERGRLVAGG